MEPHVGGRMETVARRPITDPGDRFRLGVLAVAAVAVHGWLLNHTFVTARDGVGFARYALQIGRPSQLPPDPADPARPRTIQDVFKQGEHPPGFPLAVYATSLGVRAAYQPGGLHELQDQMLYAVQLTAAIGGVLLVFPTYWLGRLLFGKFAGFAGALMFQVLPVPAHITSDGLTEGAYLFGLVSALLFGTRAAARPSIGRFLQCGLATGVTYLIRPEGALAGLACAMVAVGMAGVGRWPRRAVAGWLTALGVGGLIPAAPYMVLIGGITNKPAMNGVIGNFIGSPRQQILESWKAEQGAIRGADRAALFGAWYVPSKDGPRAAWAVMAVAKETLKGMYYAPALWAAVGLAVAVRRLRTDPKFWVPILFASMTVGLLLTLAYTKWYVSERHTLPLVLVGCLFAAGGLEPAGRWAATRRFTKDIVGAVGGPYPAAVCVLVAIVLAAVPSALKPLHEHRAGHKYAGEFLAANAAPEDVIIDPFEWAQFYAGRALYTIPPDPVNPPWRWAVVEASKKDNPHSRLPRMEDARNVQNDGRAVVAFAWPEGKSADEAEVVVYRLDASKP